MSDDVAIICPYCGQSFQSPMSNLYQCSFCKEQFFAEIEADELGEPDVTPTENPEKLDERHIKFIELERRSLYRSRTYMLVLGFACVGAAAQCAWIALRSESPAIYAAVAAVAIYFSLRFFQRARTLRIAAEKTHLSEPSSNPNFSTLGNGSQFAEKLEDMTRTGEK